MVLPERMFQECSVRNLKIHEFEIQEFEILHFEFMCTSFIFVITNNLQCGNDFLVYFS